MAAGAAVRSRKGRHPADRGQARAWPRSCAGDGHGARRLSASSPEAAFTEFAPAKINLCLHVIGRRADGYHLLDSLVAFADIGDEVSAASADTLSLAVSGPEAGALAGLGDDNLVLRAARDLAAHHRIAPFVALTLDKQLPVASGIGGGSSDAAAALRALAALWRLPLGDVAPLAIALGADVPACLSGCPAWVGGVGEQLDPVLGLPPLGIVLANPRRELPTAAVFRAREGEFSPPARRELPTAAVFRAREGEFSPPARRVSDLFDPEMLLAMLAATSNDLTAAAVSLVPEIAAVLDRLALLPGARLARMSGSGATCFSLFADRAAADRGAADLARAEPQWWVRAGSLLSGPLRVRPGAGRR